MESPQYDDRLRTKPLKDLKKCPSIEEKYTELGKENGFLGNQLNGEKQAFKGGKYKEYSGGTIFWHPSSCAHEVHGEILEKYKSLNGEKGLLGYPTTDEQEIPIETGYYNEFHGGRIYRTTSTKAHEIHGEILEKYKSLGAEKGILGYPITDQLQTPDGIGEYNHFQEGSIYWTSETGAHEIHGEIKDKWAEKNWEKGVLGYPITDQLQSPDGKVEYNHFQKGSIYKTSKTGAHEIHGKIKDKWVSMGAENSWLGYPTSDEIKIPGGVCNHFEYGYIFILPIRNVPEVFATRSIMLSGNLFDLSGNISPSKMADYIKEDMKLKWFQKEVALKGIDEVKQRFVGDKARKRYFNTSDTGWCSEFAAWVYYHSGMADISYCSIHVFWCWNHVYLHEVTLTKEMAKLFRYNGNRFHCNKIWSVFWKNDPVITPQTAKVGDYIALSASGDALGHSAIIVGVTYNKKFLWIVEGSAGDKTKMTRMAYYIDGELNPKITGIGKIDSGLFGDNISSIKIP